MYRRKNRKPLSSFFARPFNEVTDSVEGSGLRNFFLTDAAKIKLLVLVFAPICLVSFPFCNFCNFLKQFFDPPSHSRPPVHLRCFLDSTTIFTKWVVYFSESKRVSAREPNQVASSLSAALHPTPPPPRRLDYKH